MVVCRKGSVDDDAAVRLHCAVWGSFRDGYLCAAFAGKGLSDVQGHLAQKRVNCFGHGFGC